MLKDTIALVMCAAFIVLAVAASAAPPPGARDKAQPLARLRASGIHFVDQKGAEVLLRGINLGSWLLQEMWMTPFVTEPPERSTLPKIPDHVTLYRVLETRFGQDGARALRAAWRENWLQDTDFDRIREAGFNHVRLPILWSVVEEPGGMDLIRTAVARANARGLYVILDLHGLPGSQSGDHTTGEAGANRYFFDPENVRRSERIWESLARAFGKNPGVAAFDLINEPTGAPNPATLHVVYNRLYQVVRKAAPDTIIILDDGYKGFDTTPHPNVAGWENIAYTLHFYHFDAKDTKEHLSKLERELPRILELRGYRNVPVYIGEFQIEPHGQPETMETFIGTLDKNDLSWAMWTYKAVVARAGIGYWGLYQNPRPIDAINPYLNTEEEIRKKIASVRTERLEPVRELLAVFQKALRTEPPRAASGP